MIWEYSVRETYMLGAHELEEMGNKGWELVTVTNPEMGRRLLVFKRPKVLEYEGYKLVEDASRNLARR